MIIMALGLLTALWFIVLGFANFSVHSLRLVQSELASERAQWAADAGLRLAVQAVLKDSAYVPSTSWVKMAHTPSTYKVELFTQTKSPVTIPSGCVYLRSTGKDKSGKTHKAAAVIKLGVKTTQSLLNFSVFANSLTLNGGCKIDSFDSTVSALLRGTAANVATNSVTAGAIKLLGGSYIAGAMQVGVGGKVGTAKPLTPTTNSTNVIWKDWSCFSTGTESAMTSSLDFPKVSAPAAGTTNVNVNYAGADVKAGSYGALTASGGGEVRLSGGTYVFSSITLTGGAKLAFKGTAANPCVVYITKTLDLSGGTMYNTSLQPRNMTFMLAKDAQAKMTGGAQAFAVVYGPEADFTLQGGTDLYGAIVGRTVTVQNGASIHYDVDLIKTPPAVLSTTSGSTSASAIVSYQRL